MTLEIKDNTVFGFIKPAIDVHTMGMSTIAGILRECGYRVEIAPQEIMEAVENIHKANNRSLVKRWIETKGINIIGFSYRLDPMDGRDLFCAFYNMLLDTELLDGRNGKIEALSFAGLPDSCALINREIHDSRIILFKGDESPVESLKKYGVPDRKYPAAFTSVQPYDAMLLDFATGFISAGQYKNVTPQDHFGYQECGTEKDSFAARLAYARKRGSLPLIRVHAGPYSPNRLEALNEFSAWTKELAQSGLLDVLSIGSSQLTQQHFGENWDGMPNGGGVPVNSELEYKRIAADARPMLVRTYAGTKDVPGMARMHERCLNISWHALSFWWFCELDGRGNNTVLENLREHIETIKYIASTGKPLEPNVPHHFSFRGGDDVSYIVSGFLAAKTAKKYGIRHLILQNMLNTPKYTWGIEDLAKGRAMLKLVRELEDSGFKVSLQSRAGLDYFSPDLDKAKVQLAAITALMDDIEPDRADSPEIIHVVSYSEAVRLATPPVIKESIKITLGALKEYRRQKNAGLIPPMANDPAVRYRFEELYTEAKEAIRLLEMHIPNLYTPEGLYKVYQAGFLPTPYILDQEKKFPESTKWNTAIINGAVKVVDDNGKPIDTISRYKSIIQAGIQ